MSIRKYGEGQIEIIIPKAEQQELEYIERRISTAGLLVFRITASHDFRAHRAVISIATNRRMTPLSQDIVKLDGKEVARWVEIDETEFKRSPRIRSQKPSARLGDAHGGQDAASDWS